MKIINVNQSAKVVGGSDIYWKSLTELLKENGNEVFEFTPKEKSDVIYPVELDFKNPKMLDYLKYCYNFEAGNKLNNFVDKYKPQIAHLHIYYGKLTTSILKSFKKNDVPIVQTLHEYKIVCPTYKMYRNDSVCYDCANNKFYKAIFNKCNRNSVARTTLTSLESYISLFNGSQNLIQQYISVSDYQRNELIKMGFNGNKVKTVHNFIDDSLFIPSNQNGEYFLYFGRIEKEKGIKVILDAAELTKNQGVKFLLVGDGSFLAEALKIVQQKKLHNVYFNGPALRSEIPQFINKSIAVLAPSLWSETFGLVLIEAFACSKPVIASNIGGMTEIISNSVDGFLIAPGSVSDLVEKITYLSTHNNVSEKMGKLGLQKQKTIFSKEEHYRKINNIYNEVLNNG